VSKNSVFGFCMIFSLLSLVLICLAQRWRGWIRHKLHDLCERLVDLLHNWLTNAFWQQIELRAQVIRRPRIGAEGRHVAVQRLVHALNRLGHGHQRCGLKPVLRAIFLDSLRELLQHLIVFRTELVPAGERPPGNEQHHKGIQCDQDERDVEKLVMVGAQQLLQQFLKLGCIQIHHPLSIYPNMGKCVSIYCSTTVLCLRSICLESQTGTSNPWPLDAGILSARLCISTVCGLSCVSEMAMAYSPLVAA